MSVLFIAHGKRTKPQGMVDMAAFLGQRGHAASVAHVWGDVKAIGRLDHTPDIVGLSVHTENAGRLRQAVGIVRRRWPKAKLVIGGPHVCSDVFDQEPDFLGLADWLVIGDGEYAMLDILDGAAPGIIHGVPLSQEDFARLPMPTADTVRAMFRARPEAILMNRGCPFSCSFCHAFRKRIVYRDPGQVVAYLRMLDDAVGVRAWFVTDDVFAVNKTWLGQFADEVQKQNYTKPLRCFIHGRMFDQERFDLLRRAGVVHVTLGAESGDDDVLRLANKGTTLADYERINDMFRGQTAAELHCLWMLGLPGETPQTLLATLDAARRIGQRGPNFGFATPYPGTQFYQTVAEHGRIVEPNWHRWTPNRVSFVPNGATVADLRRAMQAGKRIRM